MSSVKSPEKLSARQEDKIVVEKDEAEEFLPGWKTEVKIRKTGSATNKIDRYYTDPVTGYIFRSLKDVQRYLKTGEVGRLAKKPKDKTCLNKDNEDKKLHMAGKHSSSFVEMKCVENLVESMNMENRIHFSENASDTCKKIMKASLPVSSPSSEKSTHKQPPKDGSEGYRKRSRSSEQKKSELPNQTHKQSQCQIVVGKDKAEEFLPGWTKEVKIRKTGSATKIDRYYTDPVTGYVFRSLKDVQRYLKTGEVGRLAKKPKDKTCLDKDNEDKKLHMAGKLGSSLVELKLVGNLVESMNMENKIRVSENASYTCKKIVKESLPVSSPSSKKSTHKQPPKDGSEGYRKRSRSSEQKKSELPYRFSKRLAEINIDESVRLLPEPKTRQATRLSGITIDSSSLSLPEPEKRQAMRQSGIKADESVRSSPSLLKRKTCQASRSSRICVDASPPQPRTTCQATARHVRKVEPRTTFDSAPLKENNQKTGPTILPPYTATEEPPPPPPTIVPPVNLHRKQESSTNFSMNDLWTDPCIEFAVKTLTGAIPFKDLNFPPPPLEPPELWTDPCIEFAVKTLTGTIEDPYVQDYIRPQSASTSAVHSFSSPDIGRNFCQTEVLSKHYENKQQDSVVPKLNGNM